MANVPNKLAWGQHGWSFWRHEKGYTCIVSTTSTLASVYRFVRIARMDLILISILPIVLAS